MIGMSDPADTDTAAGPGNVFDDKRLT